MIVFPNAKINLGLNIPGKRKDGFHSLETIFVPIGFSDILEIVPSGKADQLTLSGLPIEGARQDNLVLKALHLMRQGHKFPPVRMHLHKIIPPGAGLGGGSSDAAFTLSTLNRLFNLGITSETLRVMASRLGADCSFFIDNRLSKATGKGDICSALEPRHGSFSLVLAIPPFTISTKEAFNSVLPDPAVVSPFTTFLQSPDSWREAFKNHFERTLFTRYPILKNLIDAYYLCGATYASLSGSGSAVYGIFPQAPETCPGIDTYRIWQGVIEL